MNEKRGRKLYLSKRERDSYEQDRVTFNDQLKDPRIKDKAQVAKNLRRVEGILEQQSPPELRGQDLDRAVKTERELLDNLKTSMPSQEEMRRNPPGAVGKNIAFHKRFGDSILRWKNLRRAIHRDSDDPDVSNLETVRPARTTQQLNMDNAQIPGRQFDFPSERFQEEYPKIDWSKDGGKTDEAELLRAELEKTQKELSAAKEAAPTHKRGKKRKVNLSPEERKRRSDRAKQMHAERKAARAAQGA